MTTEGRDDLLAIGRFGRLGRAVRRRAPAPRGQDEPVQRVMHVLNQLSTGKEPLVPDEKTPADLDAATHRRLGIDLFNHTWTLIEKADRTPAETDEMIHAAHASRYHWSKAGTTANLGRGEWQCSRVYAVLGRGEPALWHARRCLEYAEVATAVGEAESWDVPSAYESMARALAVSGERAAAEDWRERARTSLAAVDAEDREIIEQDIATLPL